jgi:hypothetical protein
MINPDEIRQQAKRKYRAFLRARVRGDAFFPLEIRFRQARASDDYLVLRQWVGDLLAGSKAERGFGYTVTLEERQLRRYGRQTLPTRIAIETESDYLRLLRKEQEFARWRGAVSHTLAQFPQLEHWLAQYPHRLLLHLPSWEDLLAVCAYVVAHPRPALYLRELPLPVHTKFVEENQAILRQLLDELLPPEAICNGESQFERRFGLRYDESQIRLRLLDPALQDSLDWPAADLTITLSDCASLPGMNGRTLLIVENKMTFLTLPSLPDAVAIWGKGFQVGLLREIPWLADCAIWYWGDLDAQGFAILSHLRSTWPQTNSFLMDVEMLEKYRDFVVPGTQAEEITLTNLTEDEAAVYRQLVAHDWRLEQERIRQEDVDQAVRSLQHKNHADGSEYG